MAPMLCNIVVCCFCTGVHMPAIHAMLSMKNELHGFLFLCMHMCGSVALQPFGPLKLCD